MGARHRSLEDLVINRSFWAGKRVFVTGHTGFKGAWLCLLLSQLGAEVFGLALDPDSEDGLFVSAGVKDVVHHVIGDIREIDVVRQAVHTARPDVVIHMAAQSLVRRSYQEPVETYATNVMGTVHLLECVRAAPTVRAVVIVTSDKCYENHEWPWAYREADQLGGRDPYSNSKACAELVTAAYRDSFFQAKTAARVASVRAGNVIGGGDWSRDRLVPDAMRAFGLGDMCWTRWSAIWFWQSDWSRTASSSREDGISVLTWMAKCPLPHSRMRSCVIGVMDPAGNGKTASSRTRRTISSWTAPRRAICLDGAI